MKLDKRQFELEKQLHEQYAINNNERMSSLITLFGSLLAVLGAYGYMFLHTTSQSAPDLGRIYLENEKYTIDALLLTASVCFVIIAIMQHLCIYQGAYQRKEQFIVYSIRMKNQMDMSIFPEGYTPLGKTRKNFVQGIYGELVKIFTIIQYVLFFFSLWKYIFSSTVISCVTYACSIFFIISFVLSLIWIKIFQIKKFRNYQDIENEFY